MHRLLATFILAHRGMSAARWGFVTRVSHAPPGTLMCGNAISDPFALLVNVIGPLAAACVIVLARRCVTTRRWPGYAITAFVTFAVTSIGLVFESRLLND